MVEDCMDWDHMTPERLVQVHGGLTFSNLCADGEPEDGICHTPESGRPANVWWFGFDCGHSNDLMPPTGDPRIDNLFSRLETNDLWGGRVYRDFPYVQAEVTQLAAQLAGVSG